MNKKRTVFFLSLAWPDYFFCFLTDFRKKAKQRFLMAQKTYTQQTYIVVLILMHTLLMYSHCAPARVYSFEKRLCRILKWSLLFMYYLLYIILRYQFFGWFLRCVVLGFNRTRCDIKKKVYHKFFFGFWNFPFFPTVLYYNKCNFFLFILYSPEREYWVKQIVVYAREIKKCIYIYIYTWK